MKKTTKEICILGLVTSLALILSYVESMLPFNLGVPGAKIGLANMAMMFSLYVLGTKEAMFIGALRIVLSALLFGNGAALLYSLAGLLLSFISMVLLKKTGLFNEVAVSAVGGVMHNVGQLIMAAFLAGTGVLLELPMLFVLGLICGVVIGIISGILIKRLEKIVKRI
ncbi:MAG: Gx transporter family protein [Eubacteriales bacterium]|nr:Gx transporter family protein [Eubacteriales bacterium]